MQCHKNHEPVLITPRISACECGPLGPARNLATCGIGQWVTGPDGGIVVRGCSERCLAIREAVG